MKTNQKTKINSDLAYKMKIYFDENFGDLYFEFDDGLFLLVPDKSLDPDSLGWSWFPTHHKEKMQFLTEVE